MAQIDLQKNAQYYVDKFKQLKRSVISGQKAPHKPVLLLAIAQLVRDGIIKDNLIRLNETLRKEFDGVWNVYCSDVKSFNPTAKTPFEHLQSDGFWQYNPIKGTANIDQELIDLFADAECYEVLQEALVNEIKEGLSPQVIKPKDYSMKKLSIGDSTPSGSIVIVDEDRLCYQVKGGKGSICTISKALLKEWVAEYAQNPNQDSMAVRQKISGQSDVDKFEYGYNATLRDMALLLLSKPDEKQKVGETAHGLPRQIIFYGAPGTGKSNRIDRLTAKGNRIRTTFHPDSDYSTFVGAYKPTMDRRLLRDLAGHRVKDEKTGNEIWESYITYRFVPQAFMEAYVEVWRRWNNGDKSPFYLIIEEINRGNCAQIFGDFFQLLDRGDTGASRYSIIPDNDIRDYLAHIAFRDCDQDIPRAIKNGEIMAFPSNLYIWATMNTSDQSLFPIDSAFKRRWDWKYIPIRDEGKGFKIRIDDMQYDWWKFIETINGKINTLSGSEDKQLGYWFVKPAKDGKIISDVQFVEKVLFYLWNDVYKDYKGDPLCIFRRWTDEKQVDAKDISYTDFFGKDRLELLKGFMAYNGVEEEPFDDEDLVSQGIQEVDTPGLKEKKRAFWQQFQEKMDDMGWNDRKQDDNPHHWHDISVGSTNVCISNVVNFTGNWVRCQFYANPPASQLAEWLLVRKEQVEQQLGYALDWSNKTEKGTRTFRIDKQIDLQSQAGVDEAIDWLTRKAHELWVVFNAQIKIYKKENK